MSAQALVARVRAAVGPVESDHEAYLELLARRLGNLEQLVAGTAPDPRRETRAERALARRFVRRHEGTWNDGDENLVRGWLDSWRPERTDADPRALARDLLTAAGKLAAIEARAETLWFFLWELERRLELLEGGG